MHSTLEVKEMRSARYPEVRDHPTLVVSKCSDIILCKFKAVKFTIEWEKYSDFIPLKSNQRRNKVEAPVGISTN